MSNGEPDLFKEVLPSLMRFKTDPFPDDAMKESYFNNKSFIINRTLSMYMDCILPANMMNMNYHIGGKLKYDYIINILRGYRRPHNYVKAIKYDELDVIKNYYGVSNAKAKEYAKLLSRDQIEEIKKLLYKGGVNK